MSQPTENFRRQHDELLQIVGEIVPQLQAEALAKNASTVRSQLSQLAGKLNVHLAMEDKSLYPMLIAHPDAAIAAKATAFSVEMGNIKEAFGGYMKRWATAALIQQSPKEFVSETNSIFATLGQRIERENNDLYARFDHIAM